jgi:hypothetical protein
VLNTATFFSFIYEKQDKNVSIIRKIINDTINTGDHLNSVDAIVLLVGVIDEDLSRNRVIEDSSSIFSILFFN